MSTNGKPVFNPDGTLGFDKQLMIDYWNWWKALREAGATVPAAMHAEEPTSNVQRYLLVNVHGRSWIGQPSTALDTLVRLNVWQQEV